LVILGRRKEKAKQGKMYKFAMRSEIPLTRKKRWICGRPVAADMVSIVNREDKREE
jgi:hypothetical protein